MPTIRSSPLSKHAVRPRFDIIGDNAFCTVAVQSHAVILARSLGIVHPVIVHLSGSVYL